MDIQCHSLPTFPHVFIAALLLLLSLEPVRGAQSVQPDQPLGVKGVADPFGRAFTLLWEAVRQSADGHPITIAGYNVYRRETLRGSAIKVNSYLIPITVFADRVDGEIFYYSVRAVDGNGVESPDSFLVDSSAKANIFFLADDGFTTLTIPGKSAEILRSAGNKYGIALGIKLKEDRDLDGVAVRSLSFQLVRGDTKQEIDDVSFPEPDADISVGYNVIDGQVAFGAPGSLSSEPLTIGARPDQLSIFWFNNVSWIKLGGAHNERTQTVDVRSSRLGRYQLRLSAPATALSLGKANVFPGRFTPNGDGFNDRVYLVIENPNEVAVKGEIFDLSGRYVATLPPPTQTAGVSTTLTWSGKDASNSVVTSGLYVYRIQGDGETITGTVSVAR